MPTFAMQTTQKGNKQRLREQKHKKNSGTQPAANIPGIHILHSRVTQPAP